MSSAPFQNRCRAATAEPSANAFAVFLPAALYFISVATVTEASAIAASAAGKNPAVSSAVKPTAAINKARKDASTIVTASAPIVSAGELA